MFWPLGDRPMAETRNTEIEDVWLRIEREAREQALMVLAQDESSPLVFGAYLAWVDCIYGRTDGLSPIHRVGFPIGNKPHTTCHEAIPAPIRWMVLSPALIKSIGPCRFCEAEYQRSEKVNAA